MRIDRPDGAVMVLYLSDSEVAKLKNSVVKNPRGGGLQDHDRRLLLRLDGAPPSPIDKKAVERELRLHVLGCIGRRPYVGPNPRRKTEACCTPSCHAKRRAIVSLITGSVITLADPKLIERTIRWASRIGDGGFQNRFGGRARFGKHEV